MASQPEPARAPDPPRRKTATRRLLADKAARWIVTAGGLAIIASILGILFFIVHEVVPLVSGARVAATSTHAIPGGAPLAILTDEYRELVATADADGHVRVARVADGEAIADVALPVGSAGPVSVSVPPGAAAFVAATSDGRVVVQRVSFGATYSSGRRTVGATLPPAAVVDIDPGRRPITRAAAQVSADGESMTVAASTADDRLLVVRETATTNAMTGAVERSSARMTAPLPAGVTSLVLDVAQSNLYAGLSDGRVAWWRLGSGGALAAPLLSPSGSSPVTALTLLLGDRSIVAGRENGAIEVYFPLARGTSVALKHVREFPARTAAVRALAPSPRGKGFLVLDAADGLALMYSTSGRTLWDGRAPVGNATAIAYAPKADGALVAGGAGASALTIEAPHPEISLTTLFGKVWYEGYEKPEYTWQSSSGTEDFEPKLSLTPLLFGTLKGTIYSLLLAVPLGVLSAMYASQFLHPSLKRVVKPVVEIMASLPSVVLGFLAGLWLAPMLERVLPSLFLMMLVLPPSIVLAGGVWEKLSRRYGARLHPGTEVFFFVAVLALAGSACLGLGGWIEGGVLGASFPTWLLEAFGVRYDQRNAIVVGLAMGFAVIPIIFAIAEDAFSNVPRNLVSASLALGASQWQTVTRVVLPTASPGIFAAIMVGFGRAVGETMIVLMATGNTPIMDWSPFDGFRTLSANIAVEIPEAPQGGTLYRTIFLAALLLFILTFAVNTAAELVRQRLRRKYSSL
jgi:phosphate transport system permease protein